VAHETHPSEAAKDAHHAGGHGVGPYIKVWVVLLICTGLTVWTGYKNLGWVNLPLALTIACFKASLVVWVFMHMSEAPNANRLVFAVSLLFVLVMLFGVFGDLWTRAPMSLPSGAPSTLGPEL
jgi:cytochrome c oxidase subunit 4